MMVFTCLAAIFILWLQAVNGFAASRIQACFSSSASNFFCTFPQPPAVGNLMVLVSMHRGTADLVKTNLVTSGWMNHGYFNDNGNDSSNRIGIVVYTKTITATNVADPIEFAIEFTNSASGNSFFGHTFGYELHVTRGSTIMVPQRDFPQLLGSSHGIHLNMTDINVPGINIPYSASPDGAICLGFAAGRGKWAYQWNQVRNNNNNNVLMQNDVVILQAGLGYDDWPGLSPADLAAGKYTVLRCSGVYGIFMHEQPDADSFAATQATLSTPLQVDLWCPDVNTCYNADYEHDVSTMMLCFAPPSAILVGSVDCVGTWSQLLPCSETCHEPLGNPVQTSRTFSISTPASGNGIACPVSPQYVTCQLPTCGVTSAVPTPAAPIPTVTPSAAPTPVSAVTNSASSGFSNTEVAVLVAVVVLVAGGLIVVRGKIAHRKMRSDLAKASKAALEMHRASIVERQSQGINVQYDIQKARSLEIESGRLSMLQ